MNSQIKSEKEIKKETYNNENQEKIIYRKYNPFLFKKNDNNKKFILSYEIIKFSLIILMVIFGLISLWYATQWEKDSLNSLGINFENHISKLSKEDLEDPNLKEIINSNEYKNMFQLGLVSWHSSKIITSQLISIMVAMSFVGLIFIIPSLVFKRGTIFSIVSSTFILISLIVVLVIFIIGLNEANNVVSIYKELPSKATKDQIIQNINRIAEQVVGKKIK